MTPLPVTLMIGPAGGLTDSIAQRLRATGRKVVASSSLAPPVVGAALSDIEVLEAVVLAPPPPALGQALLDIDDDALEAGLSGFLDLFEALHLALPRITDGGAVVTVVANGHLGAWGGAHEMAFCGATVGLMRSVALENMTRGVRANVISFELPGLGVPAEPAEVADLALFLLSPAAAAVSGELILANHGRSLQMRAARDRRAKPTAA